MLRYAATGKNILLKPLHVVDLPIHLQVNPTSFCNMSCKMCTHAEDVRKPENLDFSIYEKLINDVKPKYVTLSGYGEPLLNRRLPDMIRNAKEHGARVNTVSNFTVMHENAESLVKSGIDLIKISCDGASPETLKRIRGVDIFDRIIHNIKKINAIKRKLGMKKPLLRMSFVLQKDNYKETVSILELADRLGINALYIKPLKIIRHEQKEKLTQGWDMEEVMLELIKAQSIEKSLRIKTNLSSVISHLKQSWKTYGQAGSNGKNKEKCLIGWFSAYIAANGDVMPCCTSEYQRDKNKNPVIVFGNLHKDDFRTIWNSTKYRQFRKSMREGIRPYYVCQHCIPWSWGVLRRYTSRLLPGYV